MEIVIGIFGLAIFGFGIVRSASKKKALPPVTDVSPPAAELPPAEPTFEERLERIGIRVRIELYKLGALWAAPIMSDYSYGRPQTKCCAYCKGPTYRVHEVRKKEIPPGARDLGITFSARLAEFCSVCGATEKNEKASETIGPAFTESKNFLELIESLERRRQTIGGEERRAMLKKEIGRIDVQKSALECELMDLEHRLNPDPSENPYRKTLA